MKDKPNDDIAEIRKVKNRPGNLRQMWKLPILYYKSRLADTRAGKRRQSQFPDKNLLSVRILSWPLKYFLLKYQ